MCSVAKPIIKQIRDNREALDFFETVSLPAEDEKTQAIIMNFPTVLFTIGRILERLRYMLGRQIIFLREHGSIMMLL